LVASVTPALNLCLVYREITNSEPMHGHHFVFHTVLATMSIKYYVGKLLGTQPPTGAEGMMAVLDSPAGQKLMRSVGVDPAEFKEIRS
jgi:hypothetical protein